MRYIRLCPMDDFGASHYQSSSSLLSFAYFMASDAEFYF